MNRELKSHDTPKIALALGLLLALGSAGLFVSRSASLQAEEQRVADEAENRRQDVDPNFRP